MAQQLMTTSEGFMNFTNISDAIKCSEMIAKSNLCPKDFKGKPEDVLVAIQMGIELGLKPLQSLQNICVINGRPSIWGDAALALCSASGEIEDFKESFDSQKMEATCFVKRKGRSEAVTTFCINKAKKAGLWGKQGPWTQYPERMLQLRARGFALRDSFSEYLKGLILAEEAQDIPAVAETKLIKSSEPVKNVAESIIESLKNKAIECSKVEVKAEDAIEPAPILITQNTKDELKFLCMAYEEFHVRLGAYLSKKNCSTDGLTEKEGRNIIKLFLSKNEEAGRELAKFIEDNKGADDE